MIERLPDAFIEVLTPAMEAQIRASIVATGRPKRRLRWAIPALLVELDRLRNAEATGRAAVRALANLMRPAGDGWLEGDIAGALLEADAVLATDTAKQWISDSDATRAGADAGEGRDDV